MTPFPGTDLYTKLKQENRLLADKYWDKCTLFDVNFIPNNFSVDELENNFQELMKNVYSVNAVKERKNKFRQTIKNKINASL